MIDWLVNFYTTHDTLVVWIYWIPLFMNAMIYPIHVWNRVQKDRKAVKENQKYYSDFVKIRHLFGYLCGTVIPIVNAFCFVFHAWPIIWDLIKHHFEWLLEIQLVKDTREKKD